jgi:hypothetical protein
MKKKIIVMFCLVCFTITTQAQIPVIGTIIAKVIKAIDLKVQGMQNETLVIQVAQQAAEQALSKTKLAEITGWQQELSKLYEGYFAELKEVKPVLAGGSMVKKILSLQQQVVVEYGRMGKEPALKPEYDATLNNSVEILQTLQMAVTSGLSMKDGTRLCMMQTLKDAMYHCLETMQSLNKRQLEIISNRTRMEADLQFVKRLHGLK